MPIFDRLFNIGTNVAYWLRNPELDFLGDDVFPDDDLSTPTLTKDLSQFENTDKSGAPGAAAIEAAQKLTALPTQPDKDDTESSDCLFTPQRKVTKRDAQRSVRISDLPSVKRARLANNHEAADEQTAHRKLKPS